MKRILMVAVTILILVLAFNFLDKITNNAINDCVNAGHSKSYCENHLK